MTTDQSTSETTAADDWSAVSVAWESSGDFIDQVKAPATEALVDVARIQPGDHVLELGAGGGTLAERWADLVGATGRVVMSDVAPAMVEAIRRRCVDLPVVEAAVVDASSIDQPDGSFDVVVSRMGLMFTPDPSVAFAEIHRILRPGGRVAALTWAGLEHNAWMTCVGIAAMMNGLMSGGPPVGPGQVFSLSDPDLLAGLASGAGFRAVAVDAVSLEFRAESIDAHIARVSSLAGPLATAFAAATPDQLRAVHETATELAADNITDAGVVLPARALLVSGTR